MAAAPTSALTFSNRRPGSRVLVAMTFGFVPILSTVALVSLGLVLASVGQLLARGDDVAAAAAFGALATLVSPALGALAYRFAARAFPLEVRGTVRSAVRNALAIASVANAVAAVGLAIWAWSMIHARSTPPKDLDIVNRVLLSAVDSANRSILGTMLAMLAFAVSGLAVGLMRAALLHHRPLSWQGQGFVLFLRTFGSISDTAALGPLARATTRDTRLVLLASPSGLMSSWNPATLALAGFSLLRPFKSCPIFVEATDDTWTTDVRRLVAEARVVVIDVSTPSPGLLQEVAMLRDIAPNRLVAMRNVAASAAVPMDPETSSLISYRRGRMQKTAAMLGTLLLTFAGFVIATGLIVTAFDLTWSSRVAKLFLWSSLIYSWVPGAWCAWTFALPGAIDRRSARELRRSVRAALEMPARR